MGGGGGVHSAPSSSKTTSSGGLRDPPPTPGCPLAPAPCSPPLPQDPDSAPRAAARSPSPGRCRLRGGLQVRPRKRMKPVGLRAGGCRGLGSLTPEALRGVKCLWLRARWGNQCHCLGVSCPPNRPWWTTLRMCPWTLETMRTRLCRKPRSGMWPHWARILFPKVADSLAPWRLVHACIHSFIPCVPGMDLGVLQTSDRTILIFIPLGWVTAGPLDNSEPATSMSVRGKRGSGQRRGPLPCPS